MNFYTYCTYITQYEYLMHSDGVNLSRNQPYTLAYGSYVIDR